MSNKSNPTDPSTEPSRNILNKPEAARYLHLCQRSVEMAVRAKKLAAIRYGPRAIRFTKTDLDAFIARHRLRAAGE